MILRELMLINNRNLCLSLNAVNVNVALFMFEPVLGEYFTVHIAGLRDIGARLVSLKYGERIGTARAA